MLSGSTIVWGLYTVYCKEKEGELKGLYKPLLLYFNPPAIR
jgi:hypothetical protein